jgi:glutaredoxin 3
MSQQKSLTLLCLLLARVLAPTRAFATPRNNDALCSRRSASAVLAMNNDDSADPTKSFVAKIADGIQNVFTNSPLNEGKKAVVKALAGEYDKEATRAKLEGLITGNPVLMLSFTTCPFCLKAKSVLDQKGVKYQTVELDVEPDGGAIRAEMADMIGRTSVPAIWIGSDFIGGCNDGPMGGIVKLEESGKLDSMLQGVGAL